MLNKLKILCVSLLGELIKFACRIGLVHPGYGLNRNENRSRQVVVSLTSYDRRVSSVLYYTLCSLLRQNYKPDVIVLWLNREKWNDDNLPRRIKKLQQKGLSVRYCEDLSSYKKLIPALEAYPEALIITVDDDLFYKKNLVKKLVEAYKKDPDRIYTHRAHKIGLDKDGHLLPYNSWEEEISDKSGKNVFPTGGAGTLYQKNLLYKDICDKNLFLTLSPTADDVWFYFMEILAGSNITVLPHKGSLYYPIDAFYQHFRKGSNLAGTNCNESQNDVQIQAVMRHYGLNPEDCQ